MRRTRSFRRRSRTCRTPSHVLSLNSPPSLRSRKTFPSAALSNRSWITCRRFSAQRTSCRRRKRDRRGEKERRQKAESRRQSKQKGFSLPTAFCLLLSAFCSEKD